MNHALLTTEILALIRSISEIPILRKLVLTARKAVLAAKVTTGIRNRSVVEVPRMHPWRHHDRFVVLPSVSIHGRATRLRVGRNGASKVSILIEIVGIDQLRREFVLTQ